MQNYCLNLQTVENRNLIESALEKNEMMGEIAEEIQEIIKNYHQTLDAEKSVFQNGLYSAEFQEILTNYQNDSTI